ncbi:MAG: hypothetical protein ABII79_05580 [bacterium]
MDKWYLRISMVRGLAIKKVFRDLKRELIRRFPVDKISTWDKEIGEFGGPHETSSDELDSKHRELSSNYKGRYCYESEYHRKLHTVKKRCREVSEAKTTAMILQKLATRSDEFSAEVGSPVEQIEYTSSYAYFGRYDCRITVFSGPHIDKGFELLEWLNQLGLPYDTYKKALQMAASIVGQGGDTLECIEERIEGSFMSHG